MNLGCLVGVLLYVGVAGLFIGGIASGEPIFLFFWFVLHPVPFLVGGVGIGARRAR